MAVFPKDHPILKNQKITLILVGPDRARCLEAFQEALDHKEDDAVFFVVCLDADPTRQPPHLPRPSEPRTQRGGCMSIKAIEFGAQVPAILRSFLMYDPHVICSTWIDELGFEIVCRTRGVGKTFDGVFIFDAQNVDDLLMKFSTWLPQEEFIPQIWTETTYVADLSKNEIQIFQLVTKDNKLHAVPSIGT